MQTLAPNIDFMTSYDEWLRIQQGYQPSQAAVIDPVRRYPRTGRDIGQWVHMDLLYQAERSQNAGERIRNDSVRDHAEAVLLEGAGCLHEIH